MRAVRREHVTQAQGNKHNDNMTVGHLRTHVHVIHTEYLFQV